MIKEAYYRGVSAAIEDYAVKLAEATGMEKVAIIEKLKSLLSKARGGSQEAVAEAASKPIMGGALDPGIQQLLKARRTPPAAAAADEVAMESLDPGIQQLLKAYKTPASPKSVSPELGNILDIYKGN